MRLSKSICCIVLLLMLIPLVVYGKSCDMDKIKIDSITIKEKSGTVKEIEKPIIAGKKIKVNLKMTQLNDSIEYKMNVRNTSDEDYELDNNNLIATSNYIDYTLKTEDDNLVIRSGESKEFYLKILYKNEVPETEFTNGTFDDSKSLQLVLVNNQTVEVPNTAKNLKTVFIITVIIVLCALCVGIAIYMLFVKKKLNKTMLFFLMLMIAIPVSVYALCTIEISIDSNITIASEYKVGYLIKGQHWYTDEELENYKKTEDTRCEIYYIGEKKFNECSYIIIDDENKYSYGESVNLRTFKLNDYVNVGSGWAPLCDQNEDGTYQCPSTLEKQYDTINEWYYDPNLSKYGYIFESTDKQVMGFNGYILDAWNDKGVFGVRSPETFSIHAHDVLFSKADPTKK